jgi:hypothetical protein
MAPPLNRSSEFSRLSAAQSYQLKILIPPRLSYYPDTEPKFQNGRQ